jgi:ankyrin repeat protein
MLAVFKGDPFDVELLLSAGCSVDAEDKAGRTALMCSIILVRHQKKWRMHHTNSCTILRQLILQQSCVCTQGEHKQQIEIARKLIQYGARLDSSTGTLLHTAARCGRAIHTEMLLEAAAQRGGSEEACHAYASITSTNTGYFCLS